MALDKPITKFLVCIDFFQMIHIFDRIASQLRALLNFLFENQAV